MVKEIIMSKEEKNCKKHDCKCNGKKSVLKMIANAKKKKNAKTIQMKNIIMEDAKNLMQKLNFLKYKLKKIKSLQVNI